MFVKNNMDELSGMYCGICLVWHLKSIPCREVEGFCAKCGTNHRPVDDHYFGIVYQTFLLEELTRVNKAINSRFL